MLLSVVLPQPGRLFIGFIHIYLSFQINSNVFPICTLRADGGCQREVHGAAYMFMLLCSPYWWVWEQCNSLPESCRGNTVSSVLHQYVLHIIILRFITHYIFITDLCVFTGGCESLWWVLPRLVSALTNLLCFLVRGAGASWWLCWICGDQYSKLLYFRSPGGMCWCPTTNTGGAEYLSHSLTYLSKGLFTLFFVFDNGINSFLI